MSIKVMEALPCIVHLTGTAWLAYENSRGILIDAGKQPDGKAILERVRALGIEVQLLFLTHTHYDHTGGAEVIRLATGAKVMVGRDEVAHLQNGHTPVPAATGRLGRAMLGLAKALGSTSRDHYLPVREDIIEIAETGPLDCYGSDVWVYRLGAHTAGSIGLKKLAMLSSRVILFSASALPYTRLSLTARKSFLPHGPPYWAAVLNASILVTERPSQLRF